MINLDISWSELKTIRARGFPLYFTAFPQDTDPVTTIYEVFGIEGGRFYRAPVASTEEVEDFEGNFKNVSPALATEVSSRDAVIALTAPSVNINSIQQVELVPRVGTIGSKQWTIASPNWARKTSWFQTYTQQTDVACTANEARTVYATGLTFWINPFDFTLAAQNYNRGAAGGFGFDCLWKKDGNRAVRSDWQVLVKKNGVVQTSGYTFDYAAGEITFAEALAAEDVVTVTGRTVPASGGSAFTIRPTAGHKLIIPHVEINISEDFEMSSPAVFEVWAGDPTYAFEDGPVPPELAEMGITAADLYCQYRMEYASMHQILALSTGKVTCLPAMGGTGSVPASAQTGWATGQKRGFTVPHYEVIFDFGTPSEFGQPIVLPSSVYAQMRVRLGGDIPFEGEYASVTFYAEELDE